MLLTPELFGKSCGKYFQRYAWDNAELSDFIRHLDIEFSQLNLGFTLEEWKDEWITKAGMNEIEPIWT